MPWPHFLRWLLAAIAVIAGLLYAFILLLDPYQDVPFSPALPRAPVSQNQRFAYPALARNPAFDSAIIGTSTMRLLDPARLDRLTGARFVNLAMNSATAYEQARMYELFQRHHRLARYLILGDDGTWCNRGPDVPRYTFREFPEWMYDERRWNDLAYLFNDKALENAVRMLELLMGWREAKYRGDGFYDFTRDFPPYDPVAVRRRLYQGPPRALIDDNLAPSLRHPDWHYPLHDLLRRLLQQTPAATPVILLYPPLHAHYLMQMADNLRECKARVAKLLARRGNVIVLDYMAASAITRDDANYWDAVHFTTHIAQLIERDIAAVVAGRTPLSASAHRRVPAHAAAIRD